MGIFHAGMKNSYQVPDKTGLDLVEILERKLALIQLSVNKFVINDLTDKLLDYLGSGLFQ